LLIAAQTVHARGDDKAAAEKGQADSAATKLLAQARAARAQWDKFHGFRAKLEINIDGRVTKAIVEVSAKGKVAIEAPDAKPEDVKWARDELAQTVSHRLESSAARDTPCAFLDDNKDNPLGRAIRVLNDEFHSSYRVRDRQIMVVNRQMRDGSRFTITVMENRLNKEKNFLPVCYVVNSWDGKTDALSSSATYHHTWERVGAFDLPAKLTVVTATPGVSRQGAPDLASPAGQQSAAPAVFQDGGSPPEDHRPGN
jgi:hypothetical protein